LTTTRRSLTAALLWCCALLAAAPAAGEEQARDARFQSTYIWQTKPAYRANYAGPNSLSAQAEQSYTWTVTAYLGWRPWANGELYFNPEGVQGRPLSNVTGLGGLTNAELQKSAGPDLRFYRARLFYRHTVGLNDSRSSAREAIESDQNQLAGEVDARRFVLTVGNLSITDMFGVSDITGDGRTQFLNWSSIDHGHFDYAADARGFSWGAVGELFWDDWTLRGGRFLQPRTSNGLQLDYRILKRYGDQVEIERRHLWGGQPGVVKAFAFRNVAHMASFRDALNATAPGTIPTLDAVRRPQSKVGWGVSFEQSLSSDVRVLARGGSHDGKSESYAFTEIDQSLFFAASVKGARWGRAQDNVGIAYGINGLSGDHRSYLAAGGLGFFLGDGRLNYATERVLETYYSWEPLKGLGVTLDWQRITSPGYNRDRGPVNIGSVRLHYEF
jgi:hypothetical protein